MRVVQATRLPTLTLPIASRWVPTLSRFEARERERGSRLGRHIEEQDLGLAAGAEGEQRFRRDGRAVARLQRGAVEIDAALDDLKPGHPSVLQRMGHLVAGGKASGAKIDILMQDQRSLAAPRARHQMQLARLLQRKGLLLIAGLQPLLRRHDPDLQETSLALAVLHRLALRERFMAILWFSARDVDLSPAGPRAVRPHLVTIGQIAESAVRLMEPSERSEKEFNPTTYCATLLGSGVDGAPLLCAFDNFETVAQPAELFRWIDTYVRLPNKVLITTRERAFKADFPLEVSGMTRDEFDRLVEQVASQLGIPHFLGSPGMIVGVVTRTTVRVAGEG